MALFSFGKRTVKQRPPVSSPLARAGNYAAPIDTAGVDPEMKKTLSGGDRRPFQDLIDKLMGKKK